MAKAAALVALVFFFAVVAAAHAQPLCNVVELEEHCEPAFDTGALPTEACCVTLRAQERCFCQFARDPVYGDYLNRPGVNFAIIACSIAVPSC